MATDLCSSEKDLSIDLAVVTQFALNDDSRWNSESRCVKKGGEFAAVRGRRESRGAKPKMGVLRNLGIHRA